MRINLTIEEEDIERIVKPLNNQHTYLRSRDREDSGYKRLADLFRQFLKRGQDRPSARDADASVPSLRSLPSIGRIVYRRNLLSYFSIVNAFLSGSEVTLKAILLLSAVATSLSGQTIVPIPPPKDFTVVLPSSPTPRYARNSTDSDDGGTRRWRT